MGGTIKNRKHGGGVVGCVANIFKKYGFFSTTQDIKKVPLPLVGRPKAENEFRDLKKLKLIHDDCLSPLCLSSRGVSVTVFWKDVLRTSADAKDKVAEL